jgi:hypothetical protein
MLDFYNFVVTGIFGICVFRILKLIILKRKILRLNLLEFAAFFLSFLYIFAPRIWNLIRAKAGDGYLGFIEADPTKTHLFREVIAPLVITQFLFGTIGRKIGIFRFDAVDRIRLNHTRKDNELVSIVFLVTFFIFIIGEGSSIFSRETYLNLNGIGIFARLSGITTLASLGVLMLIGLTNKRSLLATSLSFLVWYVFLLSKGSRSSLLACSFFILLLWVHSNSRIRRILLIFGYLIISKLSFFIIYFCRSEPHGLFRLPKLFLLSVRDSFELGLMNYDFILVLLGSILFVVILIPMSVGTLDLAGVIQNANPLISNISSRNYDFSSNGVERLFPYSWVPTSSAGVLYGAAGTFALFLLFSYLSVTYLLVSRLSGENRFEYLRQLVSVTYGVGLFFFLEYSTRIWFRMFWAFNLAAIAYLMIKKRKDSSI